MADERKGGPSEEDISDLEQTTQDGVTTSSSDSSFENYSPQQKLEYAQTNLSSTNPETRNRVQQLLTSCIQLDSKEKLGLEEVSGVVELIFQTISLYDESKRSQRDVEKTISSLSKLSAEFTNEFLRRFEKAVTVKPPTSLSTVYSIRALLTLLRWSFALVSSGSPFLQSKLPNVISAQGALIESVAFSGKTSHLRNAASSFKRYLRESPNAVLLLIEHFLANQSTRGHPVIALIGSFCAKHRIDLFDANKPKFFEGYIQSVLSANAKQDRGYLEWFKTTLKKVEKKEFGDVFLPAIVRLLKRTPEIAINGISYLFEALSSSSTDLNDFAIEISTNLIPHFKSVDEPLRASTLVAYSYLIKNISKSKTNSAVGGLLQQLVSLIDGTPMPYVYQRICVLEVIEMLSIGGTQCPEQIVTTCATRMSTAIDAEVNDDVRTVGFNTLASWLRYLPILPPAVMKVFIAGMNSEKDAVRQTRLNGFATALELAASVSSSTSSPYQLSLDQNGGTDIVNLVLKIAKNALQTPTKRIEIVSSVRVLSLLSFFDARIDKKMETEKIWQSILEPGFYLQTGVFLDRMVDRDLSALRSFFEVLVRYPSQKFISSTNSAASLFFIPAIYLLLHKDKKSRQATTKTFVNLHEHNSLVSLSKHMLHAFKIVLDTPSITNALNTTPGVLLTAFRACISPHLTTEEAPLLLLLSHHPLLISSTSSSKLWSQALRKTKWNEVELFKREGKNIASSLIASTEFRKTSIYSNSICRALETIVASEKDPQQKSGILLCLVEEISQLLLESRTNQPSRIDLAIYNTPEGELYTSISKATVEQTQDKNVRRAKGQKGIYSRADEKWEEEMRKEMAKKKTGEQSVSKEELTQRNELLAKESEIRKKVCDWKKYTEFGLSAVYSISAANPNAVHDHLPLLFDRLFELLSAPLVADSLTRACFGIYGCVSIQLRSWEFQQKSCILLRRLYGEASQDLTIPKHQLSDFLFSHLEFLLKNTARSSLLMSSTTLYVVFPFVTAAITHGFSYTLQEPALAIIESHAKTPEHPSLRRRMASALIHLHENAPRFESRTEAALLNLAEVFQTVDELAELLDAVLNSHKQVRSVALKALECVPTISSYSAPVNELLESRIWFANSDIENEKIASGLWRMYHHPLSQAAVSLLYPVLSNLDATIRKIAGLALAASVVEFSRRGENILDEVIQQIKTRYKKNLPLKVAVSTQFYQRVSDVAKEEKDEGWLTRSGVALTFEALAPVLLSTSLLSDTFQFFISSTLGDQNVQVRQEMVQAGMEIINQQGASNISKLLSIFEGYLDKPAGNSIADDRTRESVVIFLGGLARHLEGADHKPKVLAIAKKLIDTLKTPSESVQKAVSQYLSQLMPSIKEESVKLVEGLLDRVAKAPSYGERRGAAYGLAGAVKGLGLSSLKQLGIMHYLQKAVENKKHISSRQGALFAFECLSNTLGRLFEPYVIHILEQLLRCFGDPSAEVREATADASRAIMGQLSGHGVKLVLPALLKALDDKSWRTKTASIELLGSMAFCAPRQLSACLPSIVPRLAVVLDDTHEEVQKAANDALGHIGSVIRNPEIQSHVPILIQALDDPESFSNEALEQLLMTNFVHIIDAPSLALIMPILQRGLRENTEIKKKAAQIVGNMASLSDHKDLIPYLNNIIGSLKTVLLDPIPEVRAIAAKALGCMVKGMGEEEFRDLIPWMLETMKRESGSVERSGAAQGLSEVLAGLDTSRFENILYSQIVPNTNHKRSYVREGYLTLFTFLPITMRERLQPYINKILPLVLQGLADDEAESVRDIALRAGQAIVNEYGNASLDLLLYALEDGLFHDNWRIRQSSVQLLKDLLYRVAGAGGEDSDYDTQTQGKAIMKALGSERRNSILAALYMIRSDVNPVVRQKSLLVWKSVVLNTPKTLREILPVLTRRLIDCLGSSNPDKQQVAGRTLGDLVQKLGDRVMPDIIPILENGLESPDPSKRHGVCLGLSEVIKAAQEGSVMTSYFDAMMPAIRKALCDSNPDVREAAAESFDGLFKHLGSKAVSAILPPLLADLEDETRAENSLEGLKQLVIVRSKVVLPLLIPILVKPPLSFFNAKALASIAEVATGKTLYYHLSSILSPLIVAMFSDVQVKRAAETFVVSVKEDGVHLLFLELFALLKSDDPTFRIGAANLIGFFCKGTKVVIESQYITSLLQSLFPLLNDRVVGVQQAVVEALDGVFKSIKKEDQPNYISFIRQLLGQLREQLKDDETLPGFEGKGVGLVLPIFLYSLMSGSPEIKQQAAQGLGEVLNMTSTNALKPNIAQITGPLIRIIGDRFPAPVKIAILQTLSILLDKGGVALKSFLPPLQTTFVKALHDPSGVVRGHAAVALGKLMAMNSRVDPLVTELLAGFNSPDAGVQEAMIRALTNVITQVGKDISEKVLNNVAAAISNFIKSEDAGIVDDVRKAAAKAAGPYCKYATTVARAQFLKDVVLQTPVSWPIRLAQATALDSALVSSPSELRPFVGQIQLQIQAYLTDDKQPIRQLAADCIGHFVSGNVSEDADVNGALLKALIPLLSDQMNDVKLSALRVIKNFAKHCPDSARSYATLLVPPLMERVKDRSSLPLKLAAERALFHLLQARKTAQIANEIAQQLDPNTSRNLIDYFKRVLSKLPEESDDDVITSDM